MKHSYLLSAKITPYISLIVGIRNVEYFGTNPEQFKVICSDGTSDDIVKYDFDDVQATLLWVHFSEKHNLFLF